MSLLALGELLLVFDLGLDPRCQLDLPNVLCDVATALPEAKRGETALDEDIVVGLQLYSLVSLLHDFGVANEAAASL